MVLQEIRKKRRNIWLFNKIHSSSVIREFYSLFLPAGRHALFPDLSVVFRVNSFSTISRFKIYRFIGIRFQEREIIDHVPAEHFSDGIDKKLIAKNLWIEKPSGI